MKAGSYEWNEWYISMLLKEKPPTDRIRGVAGSIVVRDEEGLLIGNLADILDKAKRASSTTEPTIKGML